jgi:predicted nuclease with TOPRIM domain
MVRYSRRKRGGDAASIEIKLNKVQDEVDELKIELSNLKNGNTSEKMSSEKPSFQEMEEKSSSSEIMMPEQISIPSLNSSSKSLNGEMIEINGYSGTVGDLSDKLNKKIRDLDKPTNKGKYSDKVVEYKKVMTKIKGASDVETVKQVVQESRLTFKNNNLMGGKTHKRGRKGKKGTKRRH